MIFRYNLLQDEWELILNFIVTFPSVIKSTVPKITLKSHNVIIQTNKVNIHAELPKSLHRAIFSWSWNENARTKQKQQTNGNRAIWLAYRTDTNTRGFWLVKRTLGWKNFMPKNFLEINRYFALTSYCNTIGQSNNAFSILGFSLAGKRRVHVLIFSSIGW